MWFIPLVEIFHKRAIVLVVGLSNNAIKVKVLILILLLLWLICIIDVDLQELIGLTRDEFAKLPNWKQANVKKEVGLFWSTLLKESISANCNSVLNCRGSQRQHSNCHVFDVRNRLSDKTRGRHAMEPYGIECCMGSVSLASWDVANQVVFGVLSSSFSDVTCKLLRRWRRDGWCTRADDRLCRRQLELARVR